MIKFERANIEGDRLQQFLKLCGWEGRTIKLTDKTNYVMQVGSESNYCIASELDNGEVYVYENNLELTKGVV